MTPRPFLQAIPFVLVLTPLYFWLRFGELPPLAWGLTIFLCTLCLLIAVGLHFQGRPAYHTALKATGGLSDRLGAFWLLACAFGPLAGWITTSAFPVQENTWRTLYLLRVIFAIALPLLTALPLVRYALGSPKRLALLILIGVTLLASLAGWLNLFDLLSGPATRQDEEQMITYLRYTGIVLSFYP